MDYLKYREKPTACKKIDGFNSLNLLSFLFIYLLTYKNTVEIAVSLIHVAPDFRIRFQFPK